MFLLVTALYAEARVFVEKLHMKRVPEFSRFQVFEGVFEETKVRLLVTGVGKLRACAAVTEYLSRCSEDELVQLYVVNVGTAALDGAGKQLPVGTVCMASSVQDAGSGRRFYTDLRAHPFEELPLVSVDAVANVRNIVQTRMVDMEAAGICEAAAHFLSWDRVAFVKCLSDMAEGEKPDAAEVTALMEGCAQQLFGWLRQETEALQLRLSESVQLFEKRKMLRIALKQVLEKRTLTIAMQHRLEQLLNAWGCLDVDACTWAQKLLTDYAKEEPSSLKREEKRAFSLLCGRLETSLDRYRPSRRDDKKAAYRRIFGHVYVEEGVAHALADEVLKRLPGSRAVTIRHFKDVFNRSHQDFQAQKQDTALILARKTEHFVYSGAPVCQSLGNAHFYYASVLMNCLYDCEYCYLQGMYPGGHMVAFVNLEDYFSEIEELLQQHPVYLCISFDTDLLAMEAVLGFGKRWCTFAAAHKTLTIELRTKGDAAYFLKEMETEHVPRNVILAWTLSPRYVINIWEHRTADLEHRLAAMRRAMDMGFHVRACFDPAICVPDFEKEYGGLIDQVFGSIPAQGLYDASIGTFRISQEYLKTMRRNRSGSCIVQRPYINEGGVAGYGAKQSGQMMRFLKERLLQYLPEEKIFLWEPAGEKAAHTVGGK